MITIDFSLFAFMRYKMHAPFNKFLDSLKTHRLKTYNQDLGVIYSSDALLNSEYVSDDFREGAKEFFALNQDQYQKKIALKMAERVVWHKQMDYCLNLVSRYKTLEEVQEHVNKFADKDLPDITFYTETIDDAWRNFSKFAGDVGLKDLISYYTLCLSDKRKFILTDFQNALAFFAFFSNSLGVLERFLLSVKPMEEWEDISEMTENKMWGDDSIRDEHEKIPSQELKDFWINFISEKVLEGSGNNILAGLKLYVKFINSDNVMELFLNECPNIASLDKDEALNIIFSILERKIYDNIDFGSLQEQDFEVEKFKKFTSLYDMPYDFIKNLINIDLKNADLRNDNLSGLFENFEFNVKYLKNGKECNKKYKVELLPKTDPTALFVGKMTNCCQFYTGDSSRGAVLPVYNDTNAGLIIIRDIKDKKKIKAASFVWKTKDNGLVLDSFEHLPEANKAFIPFITNLSKALEKNGISLYLGSGGNTPTLMIPGEEVALEDSPAPATEGYEPYVDSKWVYKIDSSKQYFCTNTTSYYEFIDRLNLDDNSFKDLQQYAQVFWDDDNTEIYKISVKHNRDFIDTIKYFYDLKQYISDFHVYQQGDNLLLNRDLFEKDPYLLVELYRNEFNDSLVQQCKLELVGDSEG